MMGARTPKENSTSERERAERFSAGAVPSTRGGVEGAAVGGLAEGDGWAEAEVAEAEGNGGLGVKVDALDDAAGFEVGLSAFKPREGGVEGELDGGVAEAVLGGIEGDGGGRGRCGPAAAGWCPRR